MTNIIEALPAGLEASGISSDNSLLLDHSDAGLVLAAKLVCCSNARRARAEYDYVRLAHYVSRGMRSTPH